LLTAVFVFLSLRLLFHKKQPETKTAQPADPSLSIDDILRLRGLSARETEVAKLMIDGLDNEEIAGRLFRATITVKNHVSGIYRKFGVKNRAEFMAMFVKEHWQR